LDHRSAARAMAVITRKTTTAAALRHAGIGLPAPEWAVKRFFSSAAPAKINHLAGRRTDLLRASLIINVNVIVIVIVIAVVVA